MYTFHISGGRFINPVLGVDVSVYSGNGDYVNNPNGQSIRMHGPIPTGWYTIADPTNHPKLGPIAMELIPDSSNEMYGRSGFFMHGDNAEMNHTASDGCIIAAKAVREKVASTSDRRLHVVA